MLARLFSTAPRVLSTLSSSSTHASTSLLAPRRPFSSSLPSFVSYSSNPSTSVTESLSTSEQDTSLESSNPKKKSEEEEEEEEEEDAEKDDQRRGKAGVYDALIWETKTSRPHDQQLQDFIDPTTGELYPPSLLPRTNAIPKFEVKRQYKDEIEVDPDHPLWAFFHRDTKTGEAITMELVDEGALNMLRPWKASELRVKSFQDLHTLWALLLREKNIYYTQKAEVRRKLADHRRDWGTKKSRHMIQISMARIKHVLNERQIVFRAEADRHAAAGREERFLERERLMIEDLEDQVEEEEDELDEAERDEIEEDEERRGATTSTSTKA